MVQMSPFTQTTELSTKQFKLYNATNIQPDPVNSAIHYQANQNLLFNNSVNTLNEIEGFINNDLNRSVGDDSSSNNSSMDEILNGSENPFDDLLTTMDPNCQIKIESSFYINNDPYNMHIDNNSDYQQLYSPYTQLQQMPNNNLLIPFFHESQSYSSMLNSNNNHHQYPQSHQIHHQDHVSYQNHQKSICNSRQSHQSHLLNVLPTTSNHIIEINSIKQESNHLEDNSESSYCSSNGTFETSMNNSTNNEYQINQNMPVSLSVAQFRNKPSRDIYEKCYGPIVVRPRKNPAPTLASGRKSKYTILNADEERKREIRRLRNRQAAEKCKQKRSEIEEQLESKMKHLEKEKLELTTVQVQLNEKKSQLETMLKKHIEECKNQQKSQISISSSFHQTDLYSNQQQQSQQSDVNMNIEYNMITNNVNTSNLVLGTTNTQYTNYSISYANDQMNVPYNIQPSNGGLQSRLLADELKSKSFY